jgi:hypothetical protein
MELLISVRVSILFHMIEQNAIALKSQKPRSRLPAGAPLEKYL